MSAPDKILINGHAHLRHRPYLPDDGLSMEERSADHYRLADHRRSVRDYSDTPISREVIENLILTASTAPSGAHKQPWTFCAVSDPEIKKQIRIAAEKEEKENYEQRMSERWLRDLAPLGTDENKEFLEIAPWLIIVFKKVYDIGEDGEKLNNYYVNESVGIACGMLINAIHHAGLVTLTHTPSPMNFLAEILDRPKNERAYLLLPVGHPADTCYVPDIHRKELNDISKFYE